MSCIWSWRVTPLSWVHSLAHPHQLEFDLVAQPDSVVAGQGESQAFADAAAISGARMQGGEAEAAALLGAQRINVVVGRDEPRRVHPSYADQMFNCVQERSANAMSLFGCVQGEDVALCPNMCTQVSSQSE
jgi:hypothetical protein